MDTLAQLQRLYTIKLRSINMKYQRQEIHSISVMGKCVAVIGPKGVGKSTLILQYLKKSSVEKERSLYISADDILVAKEGLVNLADMFYAEGGRLLAIDEIHQFPGWEIHVKNIIDRYPELRLILSGSSMMSILGTGADLSRRMSIIRCDTLSFREYLELLLGKEIQVVNPGIFLEDSTDVTEELLACIPDLFKHFRDYIRHGAYPFFLESLKAFHSNLNQAVEKSVAEDVTLLFGVDNAVVFRRIMAEVSESSIPYTVNMEKLAKFSGTNKVNLYGIMDRINDTGILRALKAVDKHASRKPQKLLFDNSNILTALSQKYGSIPAEGTLREAFFCSMFHDARCLKFADYEAAGINFEIGGRGKTSRQSRQEGGGITLIDTDITYEKDKAPLWLAGFVR